MEPYQQALTIEAGITVSKLTQVIAAPWMLHELMNAEFISLDIKHNVFRSSEFRVVHHITLVTMAEDLEESQVVGRVFSTQMTRAAIGKGLIALYEAAQRHTGLTVDFYKVSVFRIYFFEHLFHSNTPYRIRWSRGI